MTSVAANVSRAGRLRLIDRLELARRGIDLLQSKEEALQRERVRLDAHVARTRRQWEESCRIAATWLLRARALGASAELASISVARSASATVVAHWQTSMGLTYPGAVECVPAPEPPFVTTAALGPTCDAYRLALQAAADCASTIAALDRLDAELADTRRRRRAIEQRLVPQLESDLHTVDLHLDEQDRDEALRVHLAIGQQQRHRQQE